MPKYQYNFFDLHRYLYKVYAKDPVLPDLMMNQISERCTAVGFVDFTSEVIEGGKQIQFRFPENERNDNDSINDTILSTASDFIAEIVINGSYAEEADEPLIASMKVRDSIEFYALACNCLNLLRMKSNGQTVYTLIL